MNCESNRPALSGTSPCVRFCPPNAVYTATGKYVEYPSNNNNDNKCTSEVLLKGLSADQWYDPKCVTVSNDKLTHLRSAPLTVHKDHNGLLHQCCNCNRCGCTKNCQCSKPKCACN